MNTIVYDLSNTNNVNMEIIEHNVDDVEVVDDVVIELKTIITNLENENQSLTTIIQELVRDKEQLNNQLQKLQREYNILRDKSSTQNSNHSLKMVFN